MYGLYVIWKTGLDDKYNPYINGGIDFQLGGVKKTEYKKVLDLLIKRDWVGWENSLLLTAREGHGLGDWLKW